MGKDFQLVAIWFAPCSVPLRAIDENFSIEPIANEKDIVVYAWILVDLAMDDPGARTFEKRSA